MAFTTYPLNNVDCSAEDAELFHCTRSSGIYAGDDFQISVTGADRSITIGPGLGWIRNSKFSGKVVAQKESVTLELGLSDATYPRIDAVVIRFSAADNRTTLVVKQGAAAPTPRSPVPERTEAVHELHLCNVRRPAGSTVVTAADVIDLRMNTYYCGLMADSVTQVDTEAIEAQINGMTKRLDSTISAVQAGAGFVAKTRIWRNEGSVGPIEDFSVNVDRSGYDGIEILYLEGSITGKILSTGYIPSFSSKATLDAGDLYTHLRREVDLSEDGVISFSRCQLQTTIDRFEPGTWLIPLEIYGITGIIDPNAEVPPSEPKDGLAVHPVTLADYEDAGGLDGFVAPGIYVMYLEGKMLEDYPDLFVAPDGSSAQRAELTVGLTENGALYQSMTVYFPVTVDGASTYRAMTAHRLLWGDPPMHSWRVTRGDLKKETEVRRIFGSAAYEAVGSLDGLTDPGIYVLYVDDGMAADMPELWLSPDGIRAERAELMVSNTIDSELYQSMTVYFPVTVDGASTYRTMTAHRLLWGDPPGRKWKIGRGDLLPEALPNPHPLRLTGAVEATYDGSEAVEVVIPSSVQPDWNQNDATAPGYIKNRPFYSEESCTLVHEENVTFTKDSYSNLYYGYIYASPHICDGSYADGTTCKIVIDGEEHSGVVNSVMGTVYIGNGSWVEGRVPDTGEPFCIFQRDSTQLGIFSSKPLTTCKVSIFAYEGETIHKLDTKYLPDEVVNRKPLRLAEADAAVYLEDASYGDAALEAIKAGREILVKVPNADGGKYTVNYSPVYFKQLPNFENKYLYLFYLKDEKQDLSALLGQPAGTVLMPVYGQLKMLLSQEYNSDPLEV